MYYSELRVLVGMAIWDNILTDEMVSVRRYESTKSIRM